MDYDKLRSYVEFILTVYAATYIMNDSVQSIKIFYAENEHQLYQNRTPV